MSTRWQQIRRIAAATRLSYAERAVPVSLFPLDLGELTETLWGLTVIPTATLSDGVYGKVEPAREVIRVRRDLAPERQRFVVAHEIGHIALEGLNAGPFHDTEQTIDERVSGERGADTAVRTYNRRERREQEANLFALELLIPADELWAAMKQCGWQPAQLAATFGVSLDAMLTQLVNVCCLEPPSPATAGRSTARPALDPDPEQQAAVDAPLPLLLAAGPGTGKTRSIVAKYVALVRQGVDPAAILALTFSNKAADEMRGRIVEALQRERPELAGRVEISTFHAWGLNLLRTYGPRIGLPLDVRLLGTGDLYLLLTRNLAELQLDHFKDLHDPSRHLLTIIKAISRIKDELHTPEEYAPLAAAEADRLVRQAEQDHPGATKTAQKERDRAARKAAALRELAAVYPRYEAILRREGVLDYGDLVALACQVLHDQQAAAELQEQYQYILVDEFQDINYASGELVRLLDGERGRLWAVGDAWQSIYRFRGASAANLAGFTTSYQGAGIFHLTRNYRSLQPILDASHGLMRDDPRTAIRPRLQAQRGDGRGQYVVEWVAPTRQDEYAAIAHDILRRVHGRSLRLPACASARAREIGPLAPPPRHTSLPSARARAIGLQRAGGRRRGVRFCAAPSQARRWRFGDHAVLCKTNAHAMHVARVLEAHGIPVDSVRDIFETPEVKDALAVCAQVRSHNGAGLLRSLTLDDYRLDPADLIRLVELARAEKRSLPRAARDPALVAQLSAEAGCALGRLHATLDELAVLGDAWQVLTTYLFQHSDTMRRRLTRASRGDGSAQRELSYLGRLLMTAQNFVRQANPGERGAAPFIAYIRTLRAADARTKHAVADGADVVRVMTIHAAKGLEFPVVYIPHLQEGVFPSRGGWPDFPHPAGLVRGPLEDSLQEERYLLYVAMTRARDRLVLTRSLDGGRNSRGEQKVAERSSLLPAGENGAVAPWPVRQLLGAESCPRPQPEMRLLKNPAPRMPLPASSIDLDGCRRRYLYQYVYQLYDDQSPYLRMHQAIRETIKQVLERAQRNEPPADESELRAILFGQIERYDLQDVLYAEDYQAEAWKHVQGFWQDVKALHVRPENVNTTVTIERPAGTIELRIDRVDHLGGSARLVWSRTGQPGENDHLSERVMLYALAQQTRPELDAEIAIHYTSTGEFRPARPNPKVLANHVQKIDALLEQMRSGRWEPTFGPHCDTCPFNLICPV